MEKKMKKLAFFTALVSTACGFAVEWPDSPHPYGISAIDPRLEELGKDLKMPAVSESGLVQTLNSGGGAMLIHLDPFSAEFVEFAKTCSSPILDIGAAFGAATVPALKASQCCVIADDIGKENLLVLRKQADERDRDRLYLNEKRFPQELEFAAGSLQAVLACRLFHFLRGDEIDEGLKKIFDWLVPGGKLFVITSTPYQGVIKEFVPIYEERWANGVRWPGHVEDYGNASKAVYSNLHAFLHVMDERPLRRALEEAGFEIERIGLIDRRKTIPTLSWDGREGIGVIAIKPR